MIINRVSKRAFSGGIFFLCFLLFYSCGRSAEEGMISAALSNSEMDWISEQSENFILYAPEASYAAEKLPELSKKAETARQSVMEQLQVVKQEEAPTLVFLESREQMEEYTGLSSGGYTVVKENGIFVVANETENPPFRHELGHLYSWRSWGEPESYWLSEGVAVYAAGDCAGEDLHAWAAKLGLENRLTDFPELEREFDFSKAAPHLQAGSFVKYIMDKYGVRSFRMLWENGLSASSDATGLEMDALLDNWTKHIMQSEFTGVAEFLELDGKISCE
jgi:hypothetical protein